MNRTVAIIMAFSITGAALVGLFPNAASQPYGGSVLTGAENEDYKDHFDKGEDIHYYIQATDNGVPLQDANITIEISGPNGIAYNDTLHTNDLGEASDHWPGGSQVVGIYTLYANYTTHVIGNNTFRIYTPVPWFASVNTYIGGYRDSGGRPTYYYSPDDRVYFSIYVQDQHENPFDDNGPVYYHVEHNGQSVSETGWQYNRITDGGGFIHEFFPLDAYFQDEAVYGQYRINVTRELDINIGEVFFEVVEVGIEITPDKTEFIQGEELTINVMAAVTGTIDVRIMGPDGKALPLANWTDQTPINDHWTTSYTLGSALPDGTYEIQVIKDGNIMASRSIIVEKYTLTIWTDSEAYIPGEVATVHYTITNNRDGSGVSGTSIEWILTYYDTKAFSYKVIRAGPSSIGSAGSFQVTIPQSVFPGVNPQIHVWANDTGGHSGKDDKPLFIGEVSASLELGNNLETDYKYIAGDFVVVNVEAIIQDQSNEKYPLKDGDVNLNISKGGIELSVYTKSGLSTDDQGLLRYIFTLQPNAEPGVYTITINVSKVNTNRWDTVQKTFEVTEEQDLSVELGFDKPEYYSGETVGVTYTPIRGETLVENVHCEFRTYYLDSRGHQHHMSTGTTSAGSFTFAIPADFEGELYVYVEITDSDGIEAHRNAKLQVKRADLILKPNLNHYRPGDVIEVDYSVVGRDIPGALYYFKIEDESGNVVKRESLTSPTGQLRFTVPEGNVPEVYVITGYVTDGNGVNVAEGSVVVTRLSGFMITFTLDKHTYRPGDKAVLRYKVISLDGSEIPEEFTLYYRFYHGPLESVQTSDVEGELVVEVPRDAAEGEGYFQMGSSDELGNVGAQQEADIRANPNPLAEPVLGDITLLETILLVLLVISLLVGIAGLRIGRKALSESKLPPWKKESPLPEPDKFKEPGESPEPAVQAYESPLPPPPEDELPPPPVD